MKLLGTVLGALIGVAGLTMAAVQYQQSQVELVERQVAGALTEYRAIQRKDAIYDRLVQAEERVKLYRVYLRAHPGDESARESLRYWQSEVQRLREKLRD